MDSSIYLSVGKAQTIEADEAYKSGVWRPTLIKAEAKFQQSKVCINTS